MAPLDCLGSGMADSSGKFVHAAAHLDLIVVGMCCWVDALTER